MGLEGGVPACQFPDTQMQIEGYKGQNLVSEFVEFLLLKPVFRGVCVAPFVECVPLALMMLPGSWDLAHQLPIL